MAYKEPSHLTNFIEIYGNKYKRTHFLALRFKRAIITYKPNTLDSVPIELPNNCIIVIRGKCPPLHWKPDHSFLLFTEDLHTQGITVHNDSVETLLRALFPESNVLFSHFKSNILYLVADRNPYHPILKACRKDVAFRTIYHFWEAYQTFRSLSYAEVSDLRFFKRFDNSLKLFNRWTHFAFALGHDPCLRATQSVPSAHLGRQVFDILKRSPLAPRPLPPPSFYQCEILLTDTEPVGVAYVFSEQGDQCVEYVSPMVVAEPRAPYRDSGSVICNAWLPMYQNQKTWNEFGLGRYVEGLYYKKKRLKLILAWLQIQTSEKYKFMLMDLNQIARILFGEDPAVFV